VFFVVNDIRHGPKAECAHKPGGNHVGRLITVGQAEAAVSQYESFPYSFHKAAEMRHNSCLPMSQRPPALSIIIPAYNEQKRLPGTLARIRDYFAAARTPGEEIEVIVVDDGSTDGTASVVQERMRDMPCLRLLSNGGNRGKGYSVRHGMLEARGRLVLFTDADLSSPIEESAKLLAAIEAGNDLAIGSRAIDRSLIKVHQSRLREIAGMIFNGLVKLFTGLPFHDTQCGFKAFVRERSQIIFEQQRVERFGFDPEILFLAQHHGLRSVEVPVRWAHDPATRVRVVHDSLQMFGDLVFIRWNWLLGRYPKQPQGKKRSGIH
jgi:dolichyl-phosphate beta-glucosyltransferase